MRMYADIKFDRAIDKLTHYISLGGYEIRIDNKNVQFDFEEYTGMIDENDQSILHCEMERLDTDTFPDAIMLEDATGPVEEIVEFYVYTGEHNDPDADPVPVALLSLEIVKNNGDKISVPDNLLGDVWK